LDHGINSYICHFLIVNVLAVHIVLVNLVHGILNETGLEFRLIALVKRMLWLNGFAKKLMAEPATQNAMMTKGAMMRNC